MKYKSVLTSAALASLVLSTINSPLSNLFAQGTAFTYQAILNNLQTQIGQYGHVPDGNYTIAAGVWSAPTNGLLLAGPLTLFDVPVTNGLFTISLDFGPGVFSGNSNWLQLAVGTNGAGLDVLNPRQQITPSPYAIMANSASNLLGTLPAVQLRGALPSSGLSGAYADPVIFSNPGNTFTGSGSGLTGVNATTLDGYGYCSLPCYWNLTGNAGTSPGLNFVGTTDNEALELKVWNQLGLKLVPGASDSPNIIAGSSVNGMDGGLNGAIIAGGGTANFNGSSPNHISTGANYSSIGGGSGNQIQANADHSVLAGGWNNAIGAYQSVVAGGESNVITPGATWSVISGGWANTNQAQRAAVGGGTGNNIQSSANQSFIGGGGGNTIVVNASDSSIVGGNLNTIETNANFSTIAGGWSI